MLFQNLTLKRKLVGIIFLTSLMVLLLTCAILFYYEVQTYRKTTARNFSSIANIITANSGAILIFDDQKLADEILAGLRVEPEVTAAALYDENGNLFATYPANLPASKLPSAPRLNEVQHHANYLAIYRPVIQNRKRVGTLFIRGNLNLGRHLEVDGVVLFVVLAASGALGLILSNLFQRQISEPLLRLAETAKIISDKRDYSVRSVKTSNDEIGDLTEAFNSMLDQVQKSHNETMAASRAKDDFLAALSHDLRTPLNPVLLIASDSATNPNLSEETRAAFEMIRRNVELEARLIDDLLDLTRVTRGKLTLNVQPLDVHDLLQEAVKTVLGEAEKKHIEIVPDLRADRRTVHGDPVRLEQVFWNVLKNAVKFTPDGGKITIKTFADRDKMTVKISDTGMGINHSELNRIFDAFAQGDHAGPGQHIFGGLGLGLTISRMLLELHSASIQAESAGPGQGATFSIQLPLSHMRRIPATILPNQPAPVSPPPTKSPESKPLRILLVEDHEPTRAVLTQLLSRRHYKVTTAASLSEARSSAEKENGQFDLVISDIGLPDGNGHDLMSELRDHYGLKGIALTGYGMEQDIARGQQAGFVTHLTKPVRVESLDNALAMSSNGH